jgi:hypothetical protein
MKRVVEILILIAESSGSGFQKFLCNGLFPGLIINLCRQKGQKGKNTNLVRALSKDLALLGF